MFRTLVIAAFLILAPQPALACIEYNLETDSSTILFAERIFVGEMIDYEIVTFEGGHPEQELQIFTFRVDEALKGEFDQEVRLFRGNDYSGGADEMREPIRQIVGVLKPSEYQPEPSSWHWFKRPSTQAIRAMPTVDWPLCGARNVLPATEGNVAEVKRWIEAGEASAYEMTSDDVEWVSVKARRTQQIDFTYLILAIVVIVVFGSVGAALNRRHS
ncbi:MAG: hypothetical protein ABJK59_14840 [Erythrobacter sp.]|uniref:hypothetical protein n=1 Tax=Erythrobacter sp. TaxID=1042 RepID=UPI003297C4C4